MIYHDKFREKEEELDVVGSSYFLLSGVPSEARHLLC